MRRLPRQDRPAVGSSRGSVLVIGAGMAGLAAADYLHDHGFTVTVLEARDRVGGRIWTDRSWAPRPIDLGAAWIHGTSHNPVAKLVRDLRLPTVPTAYYASPLVYTDEGVPLPPGEVMALRAQVDRLLTAVCQGRQNRGTGISLGEALDQAITREHLAAPFRHRLKHFIHSVVEQDYAAEAGDLSLHYWDEADDFYGAHLILPDGYDQVVRRLADGLDIQFGHVVTEVGYNARGVCVTTSQGRFDADRAIITLPLGVLQSDSVAFVPPLPERKQAAIRQLGMGLLNKLFLRFRACFWPREAEWIEYMGPEIGHWSEFFNLFKYNGVPILVGLTIGRQARMLEQLSDNDVVAAALQVLRSMFGRAVADPEAALFTRWGSDPFARGAYAYVPPGATGADLDALAEPVEDRLYFAGEATLRTDYGTVQAALLSGLRAAGIIVEPASAALVASKNSDVYHVSAHCLDAQGITPANRIQGPLARKGRTRHTHCPRRS